MGQFLENSLEFRCFLFRLKGLNNLFQEFIQEVFITIIVLFQLEFYNEGGIFKIMGLYNSLCHNQIVSFLQEVLNDLIDGYPQNVEKLHLAIFGMQHKYGIAHRH